MTWQFTLTGLLIGGLVGLTGMGGGSLLTPILVILFGFKPTYAVGTDILHGAIFKSFGAVRHRRLGTVHARLTFLDVPRVGADVTARGLARDLVEASLRGQRPVGRGLRDRRRADPRRPRAGRQDADQGRHPAGRLALSADTA